MNLQKLKEMYPWPEVKPDVPLALDKGWFCGQNQEALRQGIKLRNPCIILELGSWLGMSTRFLCENSSDETTVISVDHWLGSAEHKANPEWASLLPTLYETFLANCWGYKHKLIPVRLSTTEGIQLIASFGVIPKLIYVDASHDADAVENDLNLCIEYFPKALIVGDDWTHNTVREGVMRVLKDYKSYDLCTHQICYEIYTC